MLHDVQINTSSYAMVKVDMVHDNSKDLKLKMPPEDMTLTMWHVVARRVQWRQTSIDIDPISISHEAHLPPFSNPKQLVMSPIQEQLPPIIEKPQKSPIRD
jgi:hypothetical protein